MNLEFQLEHNLAKLFLNFLKFDDVGLTESMHAKHVAVIQTHSTNILPHHYHRSHGDKSMYLCENP